MILPVRAQIQHRLHPAMKRKVVTTSGDGDTIIWMMMALPIQHEGFVEPMQLQGRRRPKVWRRRWLLQRWGAGQTSSLLKRMLLCCSSVKGELRRIKIVEIRDQRSLVVLFEFEVGWRLCQSTPVRHTVSKNGSLSARSFWVIFSSAFAPTGTHLFVFGLPLAMMLV